MLVGYTIQVEESSRFKFGMQSVVKARITCSLHYGIQATTKLATWITISVGACVFLLIGLPIASNRTADTSRR